MPVLPVCIPEFLMSCEFLKIFGRADAFEKIYQ